MKNLSFEVWFTGVIGGAYLVNAPHRLFLSQRLRNEKHHYSRNLNATLLSLTHSPKHGSINSRSQKTAVGIETLSVTGRSISRAINAAFPMSEHDAGGLAPLVPSYQSFNPSLLGHPIETGCLGLTILLGQTKMHNISPLDAPSAMMLQEIIHDCLVLSLDILELPRLDKAHTHNLVAHLTTALKLAQATA